MEEKERHAIAVAVPQTDSRQFPWRDVPFLEVTNFAINCVFMANASTSSGPADLMLSSDHIFWFACLYEDSQPAKERKFVDDRETDNRQVVHGMIPALGTALHIVRDILWFYKIHYDPNKKVFSAPPLDYVMDEHSTPPRLRPMIVLLEQIFDYPEFTPFRYAYSIIKKTMAPSTEERVAKIGYLSYSLEFRVINEAAVPDKDRSINLRSYVDGLAPRPT
jgi:hypothetical protein